MSMFYFIYYTLFLSYEEILYRYLTGLGYNLSLLPCIIYIIFISCILSLIHKLMPRLLSNILLHILSLILCIYYCASFIVKNVFNITISLSTLSLYKNITSGVFMDTTVSVIQENILYILIVCLPFILSFIFTRFNKTEFSLKQISFNILTVLVSYLLFLISLNLNTEYNSIYFKQNSIDKTVNSFGAIPGFVIDARKNLTGFEAGAVISKPQEETEKEEEINHDPQILDIDFDSLNKNNTVINMSEYFKNEEYSYKNEYTGLFEDKNLIYIMAESFDGYFVNPELTPTLYKTKSPSRMRRARCSATMLARSASAIRKTISDTSKSNWHQVWSRARPTPSMSTKRCVTNMASRWMLRSHGNLLPLMLLSMLRR